MAYSGGAARLFLRPAQQKCRTVRLRSFEGNPVFKSILKRVKGALGLGVFGAGAFLAFGFFVQILMWLFSGGSLQLAGSIAPLLATGFLTGLLASIGVVLAADEDGHLSTTRVLLMGVPISVPAVLFFFRDSVFGGGLESALVLAALVILVGFVIGLVGASAVKISEAAPSDVQPEPLQPPNPLDDSDQPGRAHTPTGVHRGA